jgi:hypothetical protein
MSEFLRDLHFGAVRSGPPSRGPSEQLCHLDLPYNLCDELAARDASLSEAICQGESDVPFRDGEDERTIAANAVLSYSRVKAFTPELTITTYCFPFFPV